MMINKATKLVLPLLAALLLILSSGVFAYHYEKDTITRSEITQIEVAVPSTPPGQSVSNPDDEYVDKQWALSRIQALDAWQVTSGRQDILVAVLDMGIDQNHEDLNGQIIAEANFTDGSSPNDIHGHGTHVAGIIAAKKNGTGIVGVAPESQLMNAKIADDRGRCQASAGCQEIDVTGVGRPNENIGGIVC